ncbi:MAG: hypothetical protein RLP44_27010 [Aggregatilineales bacterium]
MTESRDLTRERALETLDHIRTALTNDDLQNALQHISALQTTLASWTRRDVRDWLDTALRGDLLTFDAKSAKDRLAQWQTAAPEDERDHTFYTERIAERTREKQIELQVCGAIAHCEALWAEAARLETSEKPPKPEFIMKNQVDRAVNIARSSSAETPDNAELSSLLQQAETMQANKRIVNRAYKVALEEDGYAEVLDELATLPAHILVPHYAVVTEPDAPEYTRFDRMITLTAAREELVRFARIWAQDVAETRIARADEALHNYQPQVAIDALDVWHTLERFIDVPLVEAFKQLDQRAHDDLQRLEQAERRARQAQRLAEENPIGAWDIYAEAYHIYPGAPGLHATRNSIIKTMTAQLERLVLDAETAYDGRNFDRFEQLYRSAIHNYTEKDPAFDASLARLDAMNGEVQKHRENVQNARRLSENIRQQLDTNLERAGELLTQLEHFPQEVLAEVTDYPALKDAVKAQLNTQVVFNQLVRLIESSDSNEIARGIGIAEQQSDERFEPLALDLKLHLDYLNARQQYASGHIVETLALLKAVADSDGHPDQDEAIVLISEIQGDADAET